MDHRGSPGFGESQEYEGTRAFGARQDPLASLGLQASLSQESQVLRGCQGPQDSGGSQGLRGSLGPQVIEVSRGIMEWANQGFRGPQGRGEPLGHLASRVQQAWANLAWMDFQELPETRGNLGPLEFQAPEGSQELWVLRVPQG